MHCVFECEVPDNIMLDNSDSVICLSKITAPNQDRSGGKKCLGKDDGRFDHYAGNTKSKSCY